MNLTAAQRFENMTKAAQYLSERTKIAKAFPMSGYANRELLKAKAQWRLAFYQYTNPFGMKTYA